MVSSKLTAIYNSFSFNINHNITLATAQRNSSSQLEFILFYLIENSIFSFDVAYCKTKYKVAIFIYFPLCLQGDLMMYNYLNIVWLIFTNKGVSYLWRNKKIFISYQNVM